MAVTAAIALGSNLGDRRAAIVGALQALQETPGINNVRPSRLYETPPVGGPSGQGAFLNAAATIETTLDPIMLHERLIQIEQQLGRVRKVRWDERVIDLDILLYGDLILDSPSLTIPHPRMAVRRFVLVPLAEVAPDAIDPMTGRTVESLLANLDRRPGCVVVIGHASEIQAYDRLAACLRSLGGFEVRKGRACFEARADPAGKAEFDDPILAEGRKIDLGLWWERLSEGRWLFEDCSVATPDRPHSAWDRVVRPSFIAALDAVSYVVHRHWRDERVDPVFREIPLLWPGTADPWPIYDAWKSAIDAGLSPPETTSVEIDAIVSGIVAACQASRTETRPIAS